MKWVDPAIRVMLPSGIAAVLLGRILGHLYRKVFRVPPRPGESECRVWVFIVRSHCNG
ncbi:hypothetical protein [Thermococcus sp.]|uniref:hypothetical protein n=1 Tax=Thermococcus sp. TaxID=35749 RepID=UPI00261B3CC7|nr:hypothetical protein [Thermococcus sp.]